MTDSVDVMAKISQLIEGVQFGPDMDRKNKFLELAALVVSLRVLNILLSTVILFVHLISFFQLKNLRKRKRENGTDCKI